MCRLVNGRINKRYYSLVSYSLPISGIYNLVVAIEAALEDVTRKILNKYPQKLKSNKKINASSAFQANSIDELRATTISDILNELAYKSPRELGETLSSIYSFSVLEIPQYHKYLELKATRDIHIHNRGKANDIYIRKSDTMARVESGEWLPVTIQYFLESYECCLRLLEVLAEKLDTVWPSSLYRTDKIANKSQ